MDYYETLGVPKTATQDEIKSAYRKLASKHHPDKGGDTKRFQDIQQAYSNLETPEKRNQYDRQPQGSHHGFHFHHGQAGNVFDDFFEAHFGGFNPFSQQHHHRQPRNHDIRVSIKMELLETLSDQRKTLNVTFPGNKNQTLEITIPRGVHNGMTIRYPGLGDKSNSNVPSGDLLVQIHIAPNTKFQQAGIDLVTTLSINSFDAIVGCEREVQSLDGKTYIINIPRGTQYGTKFGISNEGLFQMNHPHRGRLIINLEIVTPTTLTDQQIEIIKSLNKDFK